MKRTIKLFGLALLVAMTLTGCKKEYTITVEPNNPEWGTTTGSGVYADGSSITITATPNEGYYFNEWSDGVTTNPRTITVTGNANYVAMFSTTPGGGGGGEGDPQTMSGTISENVTWPDRGLPVDYVIDGMLFIDGNALLTVAPGVTIVFKTTGSGIIVGDNAGLRMVGTAENPIIFKNADVNPNRGAWQEVKILSNRSDNQFEYVQFINGGSGDAPWDGVVHVNGRLSMKHCTVDGSLCNGVSCENEGYLSAFENNNVKNCNKYPLYYETLAAACKGLGTGNSFTGNTGGNVVFLAGTSIDMQTENYTLVNPGYPYRLSSGMGIGGNKSFTIEAGTVLELPANTNVYVGDDATFIANGTSSNHIIFRCSENGEHWNGIDFFSRKSNNSISYCEIKECGTNDGYGENDCLYLRGENVKLALNNNIFGPSSYYGIAVEYLDCLGNITHSNNTYNNCVAGNVYLESGGNYNGTEYEGGQILNDLP